MSGFERRVRTRKSRAGTEADVRFEASAQAIAAGNTADELVERAALAFRAWEIKEAAARELAFEQTVEKRATVARYGASIGLADEHGNVRRLDVKRALRAEHVEGPSEPREGPSEPRRAPSGIYVAQPGDVAAMGAAYAVERDEVRRGRR